MPSYPLEMVDGVARYLADRDVLSWDQFGEGTEYTDATAWPTYLGPDVPASPDRLVVITPTAMSTIRATRLVTLQIRLRGAAGGQLSEVADRAQLIEDTFHPNGFPLAHKLMGNIRVGAVLPGAPLPMPRDGNRRHEHIQSFTFRARRP